MRFLVKLQAPNAAILPFSYQNELAAAILRTLAKSNLKSARFSHLEGYRQETHLFSFSQLNCAFKLEEDRLWLLNKELSFYLALHQPDEMRSFIQGLFQHEKMVIAADISQPPFKIKALELQPDPLSGLEEEQISSLVVKLSTPTVLPNPKSLNVYESLSPDDTSFCAAVAENWRSKISQCFDVPAAEAAFLSVEKVNLKTRPKFRLVAARVSPEKSVNIRGWHNFHLKLMARRKYLNLILNTGIGAYNNFGFGFAEVESGK